jgi:hypothetical protein
MTDDDLFRAFSDMADRLVYDDGSPVFVTDKMRRERAAHRDAERPRELSAKEMLRLMEEDLARPLQPSYKPCTIGFYERMLRDAQGDDQ